jgi:geranylgeranyl diphosphate synthase type 3
LKSTPLLNPSDSKQYNSAKGFCEDLTEGKFSFLIIHAIAHSREANNEVLNILKQRTEDVNLKKRVLKIMRERTKTFDYTREVIHKLYDEAKVEMARFEKSNPMLDAILNKLNVE